MSIGYSHLLFCFFFFNIFSLFVFFVFFLSFFGFSSCWFGCAFAKIWLRYLSSWRSPTSIQEPYYQLNFSIHQKISRFQIDPQQVSSINLKDQNFRNPIVIFHYKKNTSYSKFHGDHRFFMPEH